MNVNFKYNRVKKYNNYPLYKLLSDAGYSFDGIYTALKISPKRMPLYFSNPQLFRLEQLERIAYLSYKPLGYVLNLCHKSTTKKSVHWIDEDYNLGAKIESLKLGKID